MQNFVFDSLPLLRFFRKQQDWEQISELLEQARQSGERHLISAINWGEVLYIILRDEGRSIAQIVEDRIQRSAIEIILPTMSHVRKAAEFKSQGGASYADCFAAALAWERDIPVLTSDPEFKKLEEHHGITIEWLSPHR